MPPSAEESKRTKNEEEWLEVCCEQYKNFLSTHLRNVENGLRGSSQQATLSMSVTIKERKDGLFTVKPKGKADIPWQGDERKAEIRDGQLQLL